MAGISFRLILFYPDVGFDNGVTAAIAENAELRATAVKAARK